MIEECQRITKMNWVFELPVSREPTDQGTLRLYEFESVLHEELSELKIARQLPEGSLERFVALSDLLGDILVYTLSEACRWGIPIVDVFHIIMNSQDSKLVDGKPLKAPDGSKFIKGPNYEPPEKNIEAMLSRYSGKSAQDRLDKATVEHAEAMYQIDRNYDISMSSEDMLDTITNKPEILTNLQIRLENETPQEWDSPGYPHID